MSVNEAHRLRGLEYENIQLKNILADGMLELDLLQEAPKRSKPSPSQGSSGIPSYQGLYTPELRFSGI
jgi:hypothetical protein